MERESEKGESIAWLAPWDRLKIYCRDLRSGQSLHFLDLFLLLSHSTETK